jgi:hypothetical protein
MLRLRSSCRLGGGGGRDGDLGRQFGGRMSRKGSEKVEILLLGDIMNGWMEFGFGFSRFSGILSDMAFLEWATMNSLCTYIMSIYRTCRIRPFLLS